MEPSTRPYNPNRPRATRARGGASARRQEAATEPKGTVAKPTTQGAKPRGRRASQRSAATDTAPGATLAEPGALATPDVAPGVDVATAVQSPPEESLAAADAEPEGDVAEARDEPGPMVGVDDFEDIFSRFQTPITNFIYRLVGNREQAYDLAQDVFVKAYRALAGGATIQAGALSSWLYRIASNTATDALRRRRLISWLPLSLFNDDRGVGAGMPGADNGFGQQTLSEEHLASAMGAFTSGYDGGRFEQRVADREIVERVLSRLPEKYAACLLLYEHEGFSCAEIADVLHVTPSAVKMRLMRARERFISIYQQEMEGHR
ncbi:MAG TPA: sigma-70 family RNA polymerase sigma factor [Ktedonobacterales bacterium]